MPERSDRDTRERPDERTELNETLGVPPDAARDAAEDLAHRGMRKPSSDEVEQERIDRAQRGEPLP
jgi:hypothetical protein